ncbi:hypothetical protein NA57DRAFT_67003 [Rhizodiscina lignyota]|uniref:Class II aldolase/adducin N-terminal domain-containing protein n=1 Tax=Rhizodiscina lignyota TaxID=1504668 RepID=A0A9P4IFY8_9PEZI|nr:hypothetical protein NA57DRAFT_67003 [Rhizodiscina lignyota]
MLIAANHVLDFNGVADAFGHISIRNPNNNATFFLSKNQAPALVSAAVDIIEYHVANGSSLDPNAAAGYAERFIHSETLKRFPDVNCVIHAHSQALVPYSLVHNVDLEPAYAVAGFLGETVPNFDIEKYYNNSHPHDMLVNNNFLGAALASYFTTPATNNTKSTSPDHTFVLMRGHGFTTLDVDIETAIYRAVYAQSNANVQSQAIALTQSGGIFHGGVKYLSSRERVDSGTFNQASAGKPWPYWVKQTEANPLYKNELGSPV